MARSKKSATQVESIRHKDKRANIPTEELRDFVADEELAPKTMLYPRDPSLDPHAAEEVKRYGKLTVLPAKMNPDLAMGDELLKKTGAGNLFMVFGEPDVEIKKQKNGQIVVEIKGVDVYDPTTGQIRSASTDDIACWFIDTDYNGESFFVRHAYFTGAEGPYDKLKRALRAEIDESACCDRGPNAGSAPNRSSKTLVSTAVITVRQPDRVGLSSTHPSTGPA